MKDVIELTKALVPLAWPAILAIVLWKLFPTLKQIVTSRAFSVKVAGMEVSVQDATEQLSTRIEDLQKQVIALRDEQGSHSRDVAVAAPPPEEPRARGRQAVLWVDDKPSNNAFEISQLRDWGVDVLEALSTQDAMALLKGNVHVDAVISDMGRSEGGSYRSQAGLTLLQQIRAEGLATPFLVYSSARYAAQNRQQVIAAGGDGATSSPIELLEWLRRKIGLSVAG